jgi:hypothetical protein
MLDRPATWLNPFGDGQAGPRIVSWLAGRGLVRLESPGRTPASLATDAVDSALVPGATPV